MKTFALKWPCKKQKQKKNNNRKETDLGINMPLGRDRKITMDHVKNQSDHWICYRPLLGKIKEAYVA